MLSLRRADFFAVHQKYEKIPPSQFRVLARDQVIDEILAIQAAEKAGIKVNAQEIVNKTKAFLGDNPEEAKKRMLHSGLTKDTLLDQATRNTIIDKYREYYCRNMPKPTTDEMRAFYNAHRVVFETTPEQILARKIVLVKPKGAKHGTPEYLKIQKRAEEIIKRLNEGADFAELANRMTEDPKGIGVGGSIGWAKATKKTGLIIWGHLKRLKKGEITQEPVIVPGAMVILKVEDKKPPQYQPFEEAIPRIIRGIQIEKLKKHIADLRKDAKIEYFENLTQGQVLRGEKPKKTYLKY